MEFWTLEIAMCMQSKRVKLPNLKLKTQTKQLLCSLSVDIMLPDSICFVVLFYSIKGKVLSPKKQQNIG
jgi:hypothetical protein